MPRRHRRRDEAPPPTPQRPRTTEPIAAPSGWQALRHFGGDDGPDYRCPGCGRPVQRTSDHVVAWPSGSEDDRRHWHASCWRRAVREGIERYRWPE